MTFQDAVKTVLTEKYAAFKGRAPRSEYWWFFLAYVIGFIVVGWIPVIGWLYWLATIVPFAAVGFRRMQDIGKPGWYFLIPAGWNFVMNLLGFNAEVELDPTTGMPLEMPSAGGAMLSGLVGLIGLVIAVLFIWWLTRPSDPQANEYGPPPPEAAG